MITTAICVKLALSGLFGSPKMPAPPPVQADATSIANYKTQLMANSMAKSGRESTDMTSQKFGG